MNIIEATYDDAELAGEVHSSAWKQTYEGIFQEEYIIVDTAEKGNRSF